VSPFHDCCRSRSTRWRICKSNRGSGPLIAHALEVATHTETEGRGWSGNRQIAGEPRLLRSLAYSVFPRTFAVVTLRQRATTSIGSICARHSTANAMSPRPRANRRRRCDLLASAGAARVDRRAGRHNRLELPSEGKGQGSNPFGAPESPRKSPPSRRGYANPSALYGFGSALRAGVPSTVGRLETADRLRK
jgi:hypothetical protein